MLVVKWFISKVFPRQAGCKPHLNEMFGWSTTVPFPAQLTLSAFFSLWRHKGSSLICGLIFEPLLQNVWVYRTIQQNFSLPNVGAGIGPESCPAQAGADGKQQVSLRQIDFWFEGSREESRTPRPPAAALLASTCPPASAAAPRRSDPDPVCRAGGGGAEGRMRSCSASAERVLDTQPEEANEEGWRGGGAWVAPSGSAPPPSSSPLQRLPHLTNQYNQLVINKITCGHQRVHANCWFVQPTTDLQQLSPHESHACFPTVFIFSFTKKILLFRIFFSQLLYLSMNYYRENENSSNSQNLLKEATSFR